MKANDLTLTDIFAKKSYSSEVAIVLDVERRWVKNFSRYASGNARTVLVYIPTDYSSENRNGASLRALAEAAAFRETIAALDVFQVEYMSHENYVTNPEFGYLDAINPSTLFGTVAQKEEAEAAKQIEANAESRRKIEANQAARNEMGELLAGLGLEPADVRSFHLGTREMTLSFATLGKIVALTR